MNKEQILWAAFSSDLGKNAYVLYDFVKDKTGCTFVDIGVRDGYSSAIFSLNSKNNNNVIYGVDVTFSNLKSDLIDGENYFQLEGDSSTIGKYADIEDLQEIDCIFIDSLHVREQVLCELYYWFPRLKNGGTVIFHDSHWPDGKKDQTGGKIWERVDNAIRDFFGLESLVDFVDDNIEVKCYPDSWGMTFITVNDVKNFNDSVEDWSQVFNIRNQLISTYWNESNVGDKTIELIMEVGNEVN